MALPLPLPLHHQPKKLAHLRKLVITIALLILSTLTCDLASARQDLETFYRYNPNPNPNPNPPPRSTSNISLRQSTRQNYSLPPLQQQHASSAPPPPRSHGTVVKAVAATAASSLVIALIFFFVVLRRRGEKGQRQRSGRGNGGGGGGVAFPPDPMPRGDLARFRGNIMGLIVEDENGLDVVYWRSLQEGKIGRSFSRVVMQSARRDCNVMAHDDKRVQEVVLMGDGASRPSSRPNSSCVSEVTQVDEQKKVDGNVINGGALYPLPPPPSARAALLMSLQRPGSVQPPSSPRPPPPPPMPPPPRPPESLTAASSTISNAAPLSPLPPPPPPPPPPPLPPPPPPPPPSRMPALAPSPSLPPAPPPPPPPPPRTPPSARQSLPPVSSKPPPAAPARPPAPGNPRAPALPKGLKHEAGDKPGESYASPGKVRLKPLYWDKFETNLDHSMVWDKVGDGSFRLDDDLMEALFGSVPSTAQGNENPSRMETNSLSKIFILDRRRSQNIAIVLKSLDVSRDEIIYMLTEGQDLSIDILEKLNNIAPAEQEQSQILQFSGDTTRLADAESYLYSLLKTVPSAFTRSKAMLFRSNFGLEILHIKESIQTLELACKELRNCRVFLKLLEAVLKAGNRMNAGTSRGNAQAFNLNALRKISDVKSTDGKTTLLHFVVEEVVRSEGKRCVLNQNRSLSQSSSRSSTCLSMSSENSKSKDEQENEYIMLGLPVVGGLSTEFSNVKKAATMEYETSTNSCTALAHHLAEIQLILDQPASNGSGFGREMRRFVESAEEELSSVREEQRKAMEMVKRTTHYYQAGTSKGSGEKPLQLFVIVKDFLCMVDQVCIEIARNLQRRKVAMVGSASSSSPKSLLTKSPVRFPNLASHFMSEKFKNSTSSDPTSDTEL